MKKIRPSFIPAAAWLIISTGLLIIPGSAFPKESWLDDIAFDKWVHIGLFSILVFLWCWGILRMHYDTAKLKNAFFFIALVWLAYGIGMEFVQKYWVANRSFDRGDIIADGAGCALGLLYSIRRYIKK